MLNVNLERKNLLKNCWFQQNGAPPHCSKEAMEWLSGIFGSRLISRNADFLRPSYPLDLNPCNFYLWGYLKVVSILIQCPKTQNSSKKHQERGQADQADDSRIISRKFARPHSKSSVSGRVLVRADCKLLDFFRYLY